LGESVLCAGALLVDNGGDLSTHQKKDHLMKQPDTLIVCPTSHMDWDWISSFEEYYKTSMNNPGNTGQAPVQQILDNAVSLLQTETSPPEPFFYSVAELAWVQRYLLDQGDTPPAFISPNFCLMGGAMTSPDNIVCDGEVFVRAYLVGRQWALSVGIENSIVNISWMPDDFGHDPEVPVILSAMGLTAVGFARVPGAFPNFNAPLDGTQSLACELMARGVAFNWQAGDGSTVFAHFMPDTYGVPFTCGTADSNASAWLDFVQSTYVKASYSACPETKVIWPGGIAFAPAGGDFAPPGSAWVGGVSTFNQQENGTTAQTGIFLDYVTAVQESAVILETKKIDPSNFWTGIFGSRPAIKTLQARASRDLVAAETVSSLLWLGAVTSSAALDALDGAINKVWNILAPSSHHDFVTGTSPDRVYKMEQFPMMSLAASMARDIYRQALRIVADSIPSQATGTVFVVHNSVGVARSGIVELDRGLSASFATGDAIVQPIADGRLLVQAPEVPSLGYISGTVTFEDPRVPTDSDPKAGDATHDKDSNSTAEHISLQNGILEIKISRSQLWGMTSIRFQGEPNMLPAGTVANLIEFYTDCGNLYQYGDELYGNTGPNGFAPQSGVLIPGTAVQTEGGPLRWRAEADLEGPGGIKYKLEYMLFAGESMVHMKVTGSAPAQTTVVTSFPAVERDRPAPATHLIYGTAHHFHDDDAPPYWDGPTFKATHDFLMPASDPLAIFPLAAIYHCGMPGWACYGGRLLGSLFRNANGTQRGAAGTDFDTHVQEYVLRISPTGALDPKQGTPLVEALMAMNPLRAAIASTNDKPEAPVTLPASDSLASAPAPALVRVTRPMGQPKSPSCTALAAGVALRIYRPDADGSASPVEVTMPVLTPASKVTAELITALEDPIAGAPQVTVSNVNQLSVPTNFAVTTVAVTATRLFTTPTNGKGGYSTMCGSS
jgi:alpha-mannosidase